MVLLLYHSYPDFKSFFTVLKTQCLAVSDVIFVSIHIIFACCSLCTSCFHYLLNALDTKFWHFIGKCQRMMLLQNCHIQIWWFLNSLFSHLKAFFNMIKAYGLYLSLIQQTHINLFIVLVETLHMQICLRKDIKRNLLAIKTTEWNYKTYIKSG